MAGNISLPSAKRAASTPQKQSPAPVVSIASTRAAGTCTSASAWIHIAPRAPKVTITECKVGVNNCRAASAKDGPSANTRNSPSLTIRISSSLKSTLASGKAGAAFRIRMRPRAWVKNRDTASIGTSSCAKWTLPGTKLCSTSAAVRAAFAPPWITMAFSASSARWMIARPVGKSLKVATAAAATFSSRKTCRNKAASTKAASVRHAATPPRRPRRASTSCR